MRKDAREVVFKIIYSENFVDYDEELFISLCKEFSLSDNEVSFARALIDAICAHKREFDEEISALANNYSAERVYLTDKCALYIGMAEMTCFDDVPNVVAIDEALSLCRKYSTERSLSFVNGIFAKFKNKIENH